jgi:hypothetical protein
MGAIGRFCKIAIVILIVAVNEQTTCKFMILIIGHLGPYRHVLVDPERFFADNAFGDFLDALGIKRHATTGLHPEANMCCERFIWIFRYPQLN